MVERDGKLFKVTPLVAQDDPESWALIDEIIRVYGDYSGAQLSAITHQSESAWAKTGGPDGGAMQNEELAEYIKQDPHFAFEAAR